MVQIGAPLVGSYDDRIVALSIFIAISTSYAALDLAGRVTAASGWVRMTWFWIRPPSLAHTSSISIVTPTYFGRPIDGLSIVLTP